MPQVAVSIDGWPRAGFRDDYGRRQAPKYRENQKMWFCLMCGRTLWKANTHGGDDAWRDSLHSIMPYPEW